MTRTTAAVGLLALGGLTAAPALAATTVSRARAEALVVTVAGSPQSTGAFAATNDGRRMSTQGSSRPQLSLLEGQGLLKAGVAAQRAVARRDGRSAACSGIAGHGATVVAVGYSDCLTPGDNVGLDLGSLDLTQLELTDGEATQALAPLGQANPALEKDVLAPLQERLVSQLQQAVADTPLSPVAVTGGLDAVRSRCTGRRGATTGDSTITDAHLVADVAGQRVTLVDLPTHPAPNTPVVVGLDRVAATVVHSLRTDLVGSFQGALAPLGEAAGTVRRQIVDNVIAQLRSSGALAQLDQNVLSGTLNAQERHGDRIDVTALDLRVLPAARQALGTSAARVQAAHVTCGPTGEAQAAPAPRRHRHEVAPRPRPRHHHRPAIPHAVSSGLATTPDADHTHEAVLGATAALLALAGAGAVRGVRRARR